MAETMGSKTLISGVKLTLLIAVLAVVGWNLYAAWREIGLAQLKAAIHIDWRWSPVAALCFAAVSLATGTAWFWLLRHLDSAAPPGRLYAAYFYSQMGKYVPGKVMLLIMRLERTRAFGVDGRAVTISTLMENAAYLFSGAATALLVLLGSFAIRDSGGHLGLLITAAVSAGALLIAMHPAVFYRIVNPFLRAFKRPEIAPDQRLSMRSLLTAVAIMTPCWFFGGFALWATVRCLLAAGLVQGWGLMAAVALSVLAGMASFLPGGLGVRELVQALFFLPIVTATLPGASLAEAKLIVALAVVLQRLFQLIAEAVMGILGAWRSSP